MSTRLFVGNLPEDTSENDLRTAFSSYGGISALDLKTKSATGNESKKFAFVSLSGSNYDIEACKYLLLIFPFLRLFRYHSPNQ